MYTRLYPASVRGRCLSVGKTHGTLEIQRRKLSILRGAPSADREQKISRLVVEAITAQLQFEQTMPRLPMQRIHLSYRQLLSQFATFLL